MVRHVWSAAKASVAAGIVALLLLAINTLAQWETVVGFLFPDPVARSLLFPRPNAMPDWPAPVWLFLLFLSALVALAEGSYNLSKAVEKQHAKGTALLRGEVESTLAMLHRGAVLECGIRFGSDMVFLIARNVGRENIELRAFIEPRVLKLEVGGAFVDQSVRWPDPIGDVMELVPGAEHRALIAYNQYRTSERRWIISGSAGEFPGRWEPQVAENSLDQLIRVKVVSTAGHSVQEIVLMKSGLVGINDLEPVRGDKLFPITSAIAPPA